MDAHVEVQAIDTMKQPILSAAVSPDGNFLATGGGPLKYNDSADGELHLFRTHKGDTTPKKLESFDIAGKSASAVRWCMLDTDPKHLKLLLAVVCGALPRQSSHGEHTLNAFQGEVRLYELTQPIDGDAAVHKLALCHLIPSRA
jgi:hypothetical protein